MGTVIKALLLAAPAALIATPSFAQDAQDGNTSGGVQDIIVTAQKREQRLQDVPVSVTALTSEALAANRIVNIRDLDGMSPNLTVRTVPAGTATATYSMRGLVSTGASPGTDRGVAVYIDGVFLGASGGSIFDLANIERIEVLKGPQGTLFGRNSTGGAISITTRDPSGRFGLKQELTYGNYDQFRARTIFETPQIGPLSAIFSYTHNERRGDIRNLGGGTRWDYGPVSNGKVGILISPDWLGSENSQAVTAAVKLVASPDLDLLYKFDVSSGDFSQGGQGLVGFLPSVAPIYNSVPENLRTPVTSIRPDAVNNSFATMSSVQAFGHSLTARYHLNDQISVKNILAFRKARYSAPGGQLDGLGGAVINGIPRTVVVTTAGGVDKQWSNELQVNIDTNWAQITLGYLHYEQRTAKGGFEQAANPISAQAFPGGLPGYVIPFPATGPGLWSTVRVKSDALYGQAEFHVTDQVDIVGGARITRDKKDGIDNTIGGVSTPFTYEASKPTYLVGVNYKPTGDILAYAKFSTGYISGGYLATLTFQPETARSLEGGIKADWFNRKLRTNLSLYHVNYGNQQFPSSGFLFGVPAAAALVVNVGDSRAYGFELETTFAPVRSLTFNANLGYTDFKYTRLDPRAVAAGTTLPQFRPKWTGNFSAQYESQPLFDDVVLTLRADGSYKSRTYASSSAPTPEILAATIVNSSWLVNGRAALDGFNLGDAKATVALWGRNLFNNRNISNVAQLGAIYSTDYERARTFGVDVSIEF